LPKWKAVRVRQELATAAKRTVEDAHYRSLSEFVSEAIRLRLDELKRSHEKTAQSQAEYPLIQERLLYSRNHMWAMVTPEGNVRIGLSDYAQTRLSGIAAIQTDSVGSEVRKEEPFGVVETWMFMFDLYSPVSGKIIKINRILQEEPSIINEDSHEIPWIAEIKPSNIITLEEELKDLAGLNQYKMSVGKLDQPRILSI